MSIAKAHRLLVDGKWIEEKETMPVIDKYTGETIGTVPVASRETVGKAIAAAHEAFPSYSRLPAHRRFRILEKASRLLAANQEEIAATICREAGREWTHLSRGGPSYMPHKRNCQIHELYMPRC